MSSIWLTRPPAAPASPLPAVGGSAPNPGKLLGPDGTGVVAFLRHVGCPFAEQTVRELRAWAGRHPDIDVIVVGHGDAAATGRWLEQIGGPGRLRLVQDTERQLYAQWGLGYSTLWHFAGPRSVAGVIRLALAGIRNRAASGTRWQRAGMFAIRDGRIVWRHIPASAQELELPPPAVFGNTGPG